MKDFANNLSLHACGMLIAEKKLSNYVTLHKPPKGFPAAQMDMFTAEDIGINKFDILSQRGLGHIKDTVALVRQNKGADIDIHAFEAFRKDELVKKQIREADTIGCFYVESPSMMGGLRNYVVMIISPLLLQALSSAQVWHKVVC